MSTLLDLLNDHKGTGDFDVNLSDQTFTTGVALDGNQWQRTLSVVAYATRPATSGNYGGFIKYAADNELGVVVDLGRAELKMDGPSQHMRAMFKGFHWVNGRVWWNTQDVYLWYSVYGWSHYDWALQALTYSATHKTAVVNIDTSGNMTRVSGSTFSSDDLFSAHNDRFHGFVRVFGAGVQNGYEQLNMFYGQLTGFTDANHARVTSYAGLHPLARSGVTVEWGPYPETTGSGGARGLKVEDSNNIRVLGCTAGGGSTTHTGDNAKNFVMAGTLYDDARNPVDDIYVKGINHGTTNDDVHNESLSAYGGLTGSITFCRFKGGLNEVMLPTEYKAVRPIIKTAVKSGDSCIPYDVTIDTCDFHDGDNSAQLQLNVTPAPSYALSKLKIGHLRFFSSGPAAVPAGFLISCSMPGKAIVGDENIGDPTKVDQGLLQVTKLSSPIATYRQADPGNGNYYDQVWKALATYDSENTYFGWTVTDPDPPPPPVDPTIGDPVTDPSERSSWGKADSTPPATLTFFNVGPGDLLLIVGVAGNVSTVPSISGSGIDNSAEAIKTINNGQGLTAKVWAHRCDGSESTAAVSVSGGTATAGFCLIRNPTPGTALEWLANLSGDIEVNLPFAASTTMLAPTSTVKAAPNAGVLQVVFIIAQATSDGLAMTTPANFAQRRLVRQNLGTSPACNTIGIYTRTALLSPNNVTGTTTVTASAGGGGGSPIQLSAGITILVDGKAAIPPLIDTMYESVGRVGELIPTAPTINAPYPAMDVYPDTTTYPDEE